MLKVMMDLYPPNAVVMLTPFLADERIRQPFQGQGRLSVLSEQPNQDREIERIKSRYAVLNGSMIAVEPVPDPDDAETKKEKQPRDFCPVWRTQEDLPDAARALYSKAASLAAIPLSTLVRGATQIERRLEVWCAQRASKQRDKGKGKGVWTGGDDMED